MLVTLLYQIVITHSGQYYIYIYKTLQHIIDTTSHTHFIVRNRHCKIRLSIMKFRFASNCQNNSSHRIKVLVPNFNTLHSFVTGPIFQTFRHPAHSLGGSLTKHCKNVSKIWVKLSLCLIKYHAIKTYGRVET
jgi:hypothetical protein